MAARVTGSGPKLSLIAGGYEETDTITVYFASQTVTELKRGEAIRWEGRVYQVVTTIAPTASMPEWRITATAL